MFFYEHEHVLLFITYGQCIGLISLLYSGYVIGALASVQCIWGNTMKALEDIMIWVGDIMNALEGVQYIGRILQVHWEDNMH